MGQKCPISPKGEATKKTNFTTYGGLTRSSYTNNALDGYYVASVGALALSDLATAYDAVHIGSDRPSAILATRTLWTAYEGLLQPTVRAGYQMTGYPQVTRTGVVSSRNGLRGDSGFDSVWYRGTPIVGDEKCTSTKLFLVNEKYFHFYGLDLVDYEKINIKGANVEGPQAVPIPRGFNWSGLLRSTSQPAQVGHFYYVGNFVSESPRAQGQLTGASA